MQTHEDNSFRREWLKELETKADKMVRDKQSEITAGREDEEELASWKAYGVGCRHLPDDEHGVIRISIGGGDHTPVPLNYCVIRGDVGRCITLMQRAIKALRKAP